MTRLRQLSVAALALTLSGGLHAAGFIRLAPQTDVALQGGAAETLPTGRLLLWMLAVLVVGVISGFFTFVAIPEVMFTDRGAFAAMKLSLRTCLRNLGALVVLVVLMMIAVIALSLVLQLLALVLAFALGAQAATFATQLLLMAMLLPVMGGAVYLAWRQLIGDAPVVAAVSAHGFEA